MNDAITKASNKIIRPRISGPEAVNRERNSAYVVKVKIIVSML